MSKGKQSKGLDHGGSSSQQGGRGVDVLTGGDRNDKIHGRDGDDILGGGAGNDKLFGGKGDDVLSGGSGRDQLKGGAGNDVLVYAMAESGRHDGDRYDGGSGQDTLRLEFTQAEWESAAVQADIARLLDYLEPGYCGPGTERWFKFNAFDLDVRRIEDLVVVVDGVVVDPGGGGVTVDAVNDAAAVTQGGSVLGNVLANDSVTGAGVQSVQVAGGPTGGSVTLAGDGSFSYAAGPGYDSLALGETATDSFTYTVTAVGGVADTATVQVTVTGLNDAPTAVADVASGLENEVLALDLLANDTDIDNGAVLSIVAAAVPSGQGSATLSGNLVVFNPGTDFDGLAAGETVSVVVSYTMQDEHGALSASTATITVTGENDGPLAEPSRTVLVIYAGETPLGIVAPTDAEGDAMTVTITTFEVTGLIEDGDENLISLGSVISVSQLASLTYTPVPGAVGTASTLSYQVSDGNGGSATSTVAILVIAGGPPPPPPAPLSLASSSDSFDFNAIGEAPQLIAGFDAGIGGDTLDVSDLLAGYAPGVSDPGAFVQLAQAGGDTSLLVNADGSGDDFVAVAVLQGEAGLTVNDLLADGNLFLG
jgi:hypothetical protein